MLDICRYVSMHKRKLNSKNRQRFIVHPSSSLRIIEGCRDTTSPRVRS